MGAPNVSNIGAYLSAQIGNPPAAQAAGTRNGAGINRLGYSSCQVVQKTGAATGAPTTQSVQTQIQHSNDNGVSDPWTNYVPPPNPESTTGLAPAVTAVNSSSYLNLNLEGAKLWIRAQEVVSFTGGASPTLAVDETITLGGAVIKAAS